MTRAELLALAERVQAASGADRELDRTCWEAANPSAYRDAYWNAAASTPKVLSDAERHEVASEKLRRVAPRYTGSIDAAASLVPEGDGFALIYNAAKVGIWVGKGKTPALALLAACLFARAEEAAWEEREDTAASARAGRGGGRRFASRRGTRLAGAPGALSRTPPPKRNGRS